MPPEKSYIICATARSGSSLLCDVLTSTGLAGRPGEYFFPGGYNELFEQNKVSDFAGFLDAVVNRSATPNGVLGLKFMAYYFGDFVARLYAARGLDPAAYDLHRLLNETFPGLHYVYLTRRNKVRQAVSFLKARSSGVWHTYDKDSDDPGPVESIDYGRMMGIMEAVALQEAAWQEFFSRGDIVPLNLVYEDVSQDLPRAVHMVLDHLGIAVPDDWSLEGARVGAKLSDAVSDRATEEYFEHRKSYWAHLEPSSAPPGITYDTQNWLATTGGTGAG